MEMFYTERKVKKNCTKTWGTFVKTVITIFLVAHLIGLTVALRPLFSPSKVLQRIADLPMEENERIYSSPIVDNFEAIERSLSLFCVQQHNRGLQNSNSQLLLCQPRSGNPEELLSINRQVTNYPELDLGAILKPAMSQQRPERFVQMAKPKYVLQSPKRPMLIGQSELSRMPMHFVVPAKRSTTYDFIRFGRSIPKVLTEKKEDKKASSTYDYIRFGKRSYL